MIHLHVRQDDGQTRRFLSIVKMRGCRHDQRAREVVLTPGGLQVEQGGEAGESRG